MLAPGRRADEPVWSPESVAAHHSLPQFALELGIEAVIGLQLLADAGHLLDLRQLEDRLGIVSNRAVQISRDRDGPIPE